MRSKIQRIKKSPEQKPVPIFATGKPQATPDTQSEVAKIIDGLSQARRLEMANWQETFAEMDRKHYCSTASRDSAFAAFHLLVSQIRTAWASQIRATVSAELTSTATN